VIGLTGGIGSGKSTVSQFFQQCGAVVIDADKIAHQIYEHHPELVETLFKKFGDGIGDSQSKKIDRSRLAAIIFADEAKRKELEALTHPLIRNDIQMQIEKAHRLKAPLVLVDAALLVETGYYQTFDGLIVVKSEQEQQIFRIKNRDGLPPEEILQRIAAQMPLSEKLKVADWVIDNSGEVLETKKQVEKIFKELINQKT
jgi:dephospho-CoA kinase